MTQKNRIIEGKNWIKGGRGVKNDSKNRISFMHDPLAYCSKDRETA